MKKTITTLILLVFIASLFSFAAIARDGSNESGQDDDLEDESEIEDNSDDINETEETDSDIEDDTGSEGSDELEDESDDTNETEDETDDSSGKENKNRNETSAVNQERSQEMRQNMANMQVKGQDDLEEKEGKVYMNGKEVKVMPSTASARALEVLGAKCEERNCTIELKEVGQGNETRLAYEVKTQKEVRVLGFIKTKMQVEAQIDAENGEVIQTKRPWWSFLAKEDNEAEVTA